jgi:hypothetical protein
MTRNIALALTFLFLLVNLAVAQDDACLSCHGPGMAKGKAQLVDPATLTGSTHASLACKDCHAVDPKINHAGNRTVFCGRCHETEAAGFNKSPHVEGRKANIEKLPTCITCHGGHQILAQADPNSRTNHLNSVKVCTQCHEDQQLTDQLQQLPKVTVIKSYENSVHGRALMEHGDAKAPACVDCHGSHSTLASDDPDSPVYKTHIAATCGRCHGEVAAQYAQSVHGTALGSGVMESPTCTNCHGEHNIKQTSDPESKVFATAISKTCSDCHAAEKVVAKFGLKADRIATFKESFHGVGTEFGDTRVANCASCHGVHDIYPQSDPRSMINAANITSTCGQCHTDLPASFASAKVHESASEKESGGEWYVRQFYIWFISILILAFIIYRVLEYKKRVKRVE